MDFFDNLGKKIGHTAKVFGDKSQEFIEVGKLNVQIGKEEASIKGLYCRLGEAVYKEKIGEGTGEMIDKLCIEIHEKKQWIQELKDRVKDLKG